MKKKKIFIIFAIGFILLIPKVEASEVYYQNSYNVTLTKEEYNFFSYMFWEGCQELITKEDYSKFINSNIINGELGDNTYTEVRTRATSIENNNRTLKIVKSCSSDCLISVTLTWKNTPTVKSYDVMGAYLDNTKLTNTPKTVIGHTSYTDIKKLNNGFGVSVLLSNHEGAPVINQTYRVSKGGTVYASCQHAMKDISLENSKKYTLSKTGYGGVFQFSGIASNIYDRMPGVSISL